MANVRVKDLPVAATPASDDNYVIDGVTSGTRKLTPRVLFRWNETDLTQFDAASLIFSAGGGLTAAVDVVDSALSPGKKALRLRCTGTLDDTRDAILLLRVLATKFAMPASRRFIVRLRIADHTVGTATQQHLIAAAILSGTSGGNPYAYLLGHLDDGATSRGTHWRQDGTSIVKGTGAPAWFALGASVGDGGYMELEVIGKEGSPPTWRVLGRGFGAASTAEAILNKDQADFTIGAPPATYNGLTLDRVGLALGVARNGAGIADPFVEICEFCILKHPMDE